MISNKTALLLGVAPVLLSFLTACSSANTAGGSGGADTGGSASSSAGVGGGCQPYQVPAGTDLTTPTVSLKNDVVVGIFNASCGAAACHGSPTGLGVVQLGSETAAGADASQVRTGLVGVDSAELATMPYVTAGDPTKSYLMHKMDGDQCQFDAQCAGASCLATMPNGGVVLPVPQRDVVRRWIAQGALDN